MSVVAKFKVERVDQSATEGQLSGGSVELVPVIDGSDENKQFFKYTPSGRIVLSTINQSALEQFELGKEFYVTFEPAP